MIKIVTKHWLGLLCYIPIFPSLCKVMFKGQFTPRENDIESEKDQRKTTFVLCKWTLPCILGTRFAFAQCESVLSFKECYLNILPRNENQIHVNFTAPGWFLKSSFIIFYDFFLKFLTQNNLPNNRQEFLHATRGRRELFASSRETRKLEILCKLLNKYFHVLETLRKWSHSQ